MTHSAVVEDALTTALAYASAAHRDGRLDEAAAQYRVVLDGDPRHVEALHMLGLVHAQQGRLDAAEQLIAQAIALAPQDAGAHFNLGNVQLARKQPAAALVSFNRAVALDPAHAGAHCNRGLVLCELGLPADGVASYDRALALDPGSVIAHANRGNALAELGRPADALASHERALALAPGYAQAWYNRGNVLMELQRAEAAVESYDRAVVLDPGITAAWCNRGLALDASGRLADALASFEQALALDPRYAEALLGHGNALVKLARLNEALADYDAALALDAASAEAWCNRGIVCFELGRLADAIASFERALALDPDAAKVHRHLAIARLATGDLVRGFAEYEWRWTTRAFVRRPFAQPRWSGGDLVGKTILLYGEQGLGDAIQFCRYAPLVAARGAQVVLEVPAALTELVATLPGVSQVVAFGMPLPPFDLHCPLMSLPHALATTLETVPSAVPYLSSDAARVAAWRARLASLPRPRIGLAWAGNPQHVNDAHRSIDLRALQPLVGGTRAGFVALQRDVSPGDAEWLERHGVARLGASFPDMAAAIEALDLVVSVDTSLVHLAGALAKPVWVLLAFAADWRWLRVRSDSPWYPSARLFRQSARGVWDDVIARVAAEIDRWAGPPPKA